MREHEGHTLKEELAALKKRGFFRLIVNGELIDLNERSYTSSKKGVFVLVDRFVLRKDEKASEARLADSIQTAFVEGDGYATLYNLGTKEQLSFNQHFECPVDHIRYEEPEPHLFSFNNPIGACPKCQGFGRAVGLDMDLIVPNREKSLRDGAIQPWTTPKFRENLRDLFSVAAGAKIPMNVPFAKTYAGTIEYRHERVWPPIRRDQRILQNGGAQGVQDSIPRALEQIPRVHDMR